MAINFFDGTFSSAEREREGESSGNLVFFLPLLIGPLTISPTKHHMISMSESNTNSKDAADSLGQDKADVDEIGISEKSYILEEFEFEKPLPSTYDKQSSGIISMPSLSSFDGEGEDSVALSAEGSEGSEIGYDDGDYEDDDYEDEDEAEAEAEADYEDDESDMEAPSMPMIPGLEVSKDARPGRFLAELTVSADTLVNKRTPEKELGARWKDGSIPLATLMKQKDQPNEAEAEKNAEERKGRGRRNSGRRRFRSKSPPPPQDNAGEDTNKLFSSVVPPARPVRKVSVELPPMSPIPGGAFSKSGPFASMEIPVKPERKVSLLNAKMTASSDPLITPSPSDSERSIQPDIKMSLPSILLEPPSATGPTSGALPPLKPMRQTTRQSFESVVETITENSNNDDEEDFRPIAEGTSNAAVGMLSEEALPPLKPMRQTTRHIYDSVETIAEDSDDEDEDDGHPIMEGTSYQVPAIDMPSQPQRRETYYDDTTPLSAVEENFEAEGYPADEMPNPPQRQVTVDASLGVRHSSTRRCSLIDDE